MSSNKSSVAQSFVVEFQDTTSPIGTFENLGRFETAEQAEKHAEKTAYNMGRNARNLFGISSDDSYMLQEKKLWVVDGLTKERLSFTTPYAELDKEAKLIPALNYPSPYGVTESRAIPLDLGLDND